MKIPGETTVLTLKDPNIKFDEPRSVMVAAEGDDLGKEM